MKSDEVKLVLCAPTYTLSEKMLSCKCFPRVSTMPVTQSLQSIYWKNELCVALQLFLILVRSFGFIAPKTLNYLTFQSFDFVYTLQRLCHLL
jgi:hypothetical protein